MRELTALEGKYSRVDVHINSPGGSVFEGLAICNAIKASKLDIHTYNDGLAASMGAVILCAPHKAENRHAAKGSLTMIHNASSIVWGNSQDMQDASGMLDSNDSVLAGVFADASGKTTDQIKADYFDYHDHWMTAEEAVDAGFVMIESYAAEKMPDNIINMSIDKVAALYNGQQPDANPSFIDRVKNVVEEYFNSKNQTTDMKFPKIEALAKLPAAEVTQDMVNAAMTELAEAGIEGVSIVLESEQVALATSAENAVQVAEENKILQAANTELTSRVESLTALVNKPAEDGAAPKAEADKIPNSGGDPKYNVTSVDQEKARMQAEWK